MRRNLAVLTLSAAAALAAGWMTACGGSSGSDVRSASTAVPPAAVLQTAAESPSTASSTPALPGTQAPVQAAPVAPPTIHRWPIPFGAARKREMAAYSLEHYGEDTYVLSHPKVIVEHYTETTTALEAYNTFAPDVPDNEFHELPNTCAHFLVEPSGRIDQLVPLDIRCRHTVGLNWTAIGIENVGMSDREILDRPRQLAASLALTRWLRCRYGIPVKDVIGHNESLSSPYHRERVPSFRYQTHSDWNHADMNRYRALLARRGCA